MANRKHISWKTKYASALLEIGDIPYEDAKLMSEDQIISLYHIDHGELHAFTQNDLFWNLTPRLIMAHREKSKIDRAITAKAIRIDKKWRQFTTNCLAKPPKCEKKYRWPSRPMSSQSWQRGVKKRQQRVNKNKA